MKKLILSSLIVILLFPIALGVANEDDLSKGEFWQNTFGNDAPYFIDSYETSELITPFQDVNFTASVFDIDNITTEITITLYYTFSTFPYGNSSVDLVYNSNPLTHIYSYDLLFIGQLSGTIMRYYYQAYDGENIVREGYPTYFELTWSYPPVTIDRPLPPKEHELPIEFSQEYLIVFIFSLSILSAVIYFFMQKSKKYSGVK